MFFLYVLFKLCWWRWAPRFCFFFVYCLFVDDVRVLVLFFVFDFLLTVFDDVGVLALFFVFSPFIFTFRWWYWSPRFFLFFLYLLFICCSWCWSLRFHFVVVASFLLMMLKSSQFTFCWWCLNPWFQFVVVFCICISLLLMMLEFSLFFGLLMMLESLFSIVFFTVYLLFVDDVGATSSWWCWSPGFNLLLLSLLLFPFCWWCWSPRLNIWVLYPLHLLSMVLESLFLCLLFPLFYLFVVDDVGVLVPFCFFVIFYLLVFDDVGNLVDDVGDCVLFLPCICFYFLVDDVGDLVFFCVLLTFYSLLIADVGIFVSCCFSFMFY